MPVSLSLLAGTSARRYALERRTTCHTRCEHKQHRKTDNFPEHHLTLPNIGSYQCCCSLRALPPYASRPGDRRRPQRTFTLPINPCTLRPTHRHTTSSAKAEEVDGVCKGRRTDH